ncbi:MAG TPA: peptide deformylase [Ruminococcaceae bacterium]|nr:peptide deformylase [Oscillospiraceae bacterium]
MALRNIVTEKEARLRKVSRLVEKFDERLWTLLDDMADTMYEADGVGIAGVQVGVLRRVFVVDIGEGLIEFVNPTITAQSGEQDGMEGCLSSPGEFGLVVRPEKVTIEAFDRHGEPFTLEAEGFLARAICHENDHLDGRIFKDITHHMLSEEELRRLDEE